MDVNRISPHVPFCKLLHVLDDIRRACFITNQSSEKKKLMGLTARQCTAVTQVKALTLQWPQGVALKTLAGYLQMTVPATSLLVENLVSKGFCERTPNPEDRRAVCIKLSEKGLGLFAEVNEAYIKEVSKLAQVLSNEELELISKIVDKIDTAYHFEALPKKAQAMFRKSED